MIIPNVNLKVNKDTSVSTGDTGLTLPNYQTIPIETISEESPCKRVWKSSNSFLLGNSPIIPVPYIPAGSHKREERFQLVPVGFRDQSYQQKTDPYPAIVQSIFQDVKILGCATNPTNDFCGKIRAKIQCSNDPSHGPYYKHEHCNDPLCPICYKKFASRIADGITDRVWGYHAIYQTPLYTLVFWGDHANYRDMTEAQREANKLCKRMGVTAGSIQWHPGRIKKEVKEQLRHYRISRGLTRDTGFWDMAHEDVLNLGSLGAYCERGDHFHGICSGFLQDSKEYAKATGCGYKKGRYMTSEGDVHRYAYYVATHSAYSWGKHSVRYIGNMSYANLGRTLVDKRVEDVCCEVCKARMQEMYLDPDGEVVGLSRDHVTRIVRTYKYWKRRKKVKRI